MECPVCPRVDIPDDAPVCPSCGVDLRPLLRARELGAAEYNEALRLAGVGATDAAIRRATAALALDDHLVQAHVLLGRLLWNEGRLQAALTQWQQAAGQAPEDAEIRELLSGASRKAGRQRIGRVAAVCAGLLLLVAVAGAPSLSAYAFGNRLEGLAAQVDGELASTRTTAQELTQQLAAYRASHSHTDAEYAEATAQAALRKQEAEADRAAREALAQQLASYQGSHSHSDAEYARAIVELTALREQVQRMDGSTQCPAPAR